MKEKEVYIYRLMHDLYRMARCRQAMFKGALADYGVTLHQFHLLMHLNSCGKAKVTDLSEKMLVSMPTASRMINSLCETGLTAKIKDDADRRSTYLELTPRGRKVLEEIKQGQLRQLMKLIEGIPLNDLDEFTKVTEMIADEWTAALWKKPAELGGADGET